MRAFCEGPRTNMLTDWQYALPAALMLGSAAVTVGINFWPAAVSEDQYMLAMLVTTVFLLIYYVCSGCPTSGANKPYLVDDLDEPDYAESTQGHAGPQRHDGGAGPCQDFIQEACDGVPDNAPGADVEDRIRWECRVECPKHRDMILQGQYPWDTPNWQNRHHMDENARMWYGPDPGYVPPRVPPPPPSSYGAAGEGSFDGYEGFLGPAGFTKDSGLVGRRINGGQQRKKAAIQWDHIGNNNPSTIGRFRPPKITYVPQGPTKKSPRHLPGPATFAALPSAAAEEPPCSCDLDHGQFRVGTAAATATFPAGSTAMRSFDHGWKVVLCSIVILTLHRCFRSMLHVAAVRHDGGWTSDGNQLLGQQHHLNLVDAVKEDAGLMALLLLSLATLLTLVTSSSSVSGRSLLLSIRSAIAGL